MTAKTPIREICDAPLQPLQPVPLGAALDPSQCVDLTRPCRDGILEWDVPAGRWFLVRTGFNLTGKMVSWSSPTCKRLEAYPFDARAMDLQFANVVEPLLEDAGPLAGKGAGVSPEFRV